MSGMYLGRTTLALLIPAVIFFGLFMFGTGFLSGSFYRARTTPVETVIRNTGNSGATLAQLQTREQTQPQAEEAEVESLAQATGQLETAPEGVTTPEPEGQPAAGQQAQAGEQAPGQTEDQAPDAGQVAEEPADDGARERALAELRESQRMAQPDSAPEFQGQDAVQPPPAAPPAQTPDQTPAGTPTDTQPYSFQVGAFLVQTNAEELAATLMARGYDAWVVSDKDQEGRVWHYVRVGRYQGKEEATSAAAAFRQREGVNAVPVPLAGGGASGATAPGQAAKPSQPLFIVHAGAYSNAAAARNGARPLFDYGYVPCVVAFQDEQHQAWHLVELAQFTSLQEAEAFMAQSPQQREGLDLKIREIDQRDVVSKHCF